jgi:hypothetical protein
MPDVKAEELLKIETVHNPGKLSSRTAYRAPSEMFQRKPRVPNALEVQQATAALLTKVTPEQPESAWERTTRAMIALAENPTEKTASAAVKAYEALARVSVSSRSKPRSSSSAQLSSPCLIYPTRVSTSRSRSANRCALASLRVKRSSWRAKSYPKTIAIRSLSMDAPSS